MGNFLTWEFWFSLTPGVLTPTSLKALLIFIIVLIILTVITGLVKSRWSKSLYAGFWSNLYYFFLTNSILGLMLTFFNYETAPFLSSRFWFLLWGISLPVWLYFIGRIIVKTKQRRILLDKEKEFKKYVP